MHLVVVGENLEKKASFSVHAHFCILNTFLLLILEVDEICLETAVQSDCHVACLPDKESHYPSKGIFLLKER